jgi:hypothetical protein
MPMSTTYSVMAAPSSSFLSASSSLSRFGTSSSGLFALIAARAELSRRCSGCQFSAEIDKCQQLISQNRCGNEGPNRAASPRQPYQGSCHRRGRLGIVFLPCGSQADAPVRLDCVRSDSARRPGLAQTKGRPFVLGP